MTYAVPLSRPESIVRQLRDEIVNGTLAPGSVLKDAEVASRLGAASPRSARRSPSSPPKDWSMSPRTGFGGSAS
jgi:hypothetical protein